MTAKKIHSFGVSLTPLGETKLNPHPPSTSQFRARDTDQQLAGLHLLF